MNLYKLTLPLLSLSLLAACNSSNSNSDSSSAGGSNNRVNQNESIQSDGSNVQGMYAGDLTPVNHNLHFRKVGVAMVQRDGDNFSAYVRLKNGPKEVSHKQAIYTGRRCPTLADDLNGDAFVDMREAMVAIGQVTIPLDSDLDSQDAGGNQYPNGGATGKYFYQQSASFDRMFADLKAPDTNPSDNVIKLGPDDGITLPGRVLIVQGIPKSTLLPDSINVPEVELMPNESLPVACAVLWKVNEVPADLMPDSGNGTIQ